MATIIDVTRLMTWQGNYTGMERFAFEVTKYLVENDPDVRLMCFTGENFVELSGAFSLDSERLTSPLFGPSPALHELIKNDKKAFVYHYGKRQLRQRRQQKLPVVHATKADIIVIYDGLWDQEPYIMAVERQLAGGARLAHFVCDVVPIVMPHVCLDFVTSAFSSYFARIAPQIDILFSISKHTQKDFVKIFGQNLKSNIQKHVIRFGDSFAANLTPMQPNLPIQSAKFLLTVGTVEVRKNYQLLYQVYRLAAERNIELPKLVIVGREGWMSEATVYAIKNDPAVNQRILFAGPVSDQELNWLYANCLFMVFPSLYEGWGLPVAEALAHGKICAASNSSSIPEIGGELNQYFSPYDSEECLKVLTDLLSDTVRHKLEKQLSENYRPTLWSESSKRIADYLS